VKRSTDRPYYIGFMVLLIGCLLVQLPGLSEPLSLVNEWGQAIFLVFARSYNRFGLVHGSVPIYSLLENQPIIYGNHPWGASLLLGAWCKIWGVGVTSFHTLALLVSLFTLTAVFLLGTRIWSPRVALLGATFFGLSPLSLHLGKVYGMEMVCLVFLLFFLYFADRWYETTQPRDLALGTLALIMAQACDVYALLFTPFLFLLGLYNLPRHRTRAAVFLCWAAIPYLITGAWLGVLYSEGFLKSAFVGGAGRGGSFWNYWFQTSFWSGVLLKMRMGYTWLLLGGAVVGVLFSARHRPTRWLTWLALWMLPVSQLLLCARWHEGHNYYVQFFGPIFCLQTAALLMHNGDDDALPHWRKGASAGALVLFLILSWNLNQSYWLNRGYQDIKMAGEIRKLTTDGDLLLGLPPLMSYYVDRKYIVPYYTFIRSDYDNDPERFFQQVQSFCQGGSYERVILFKQFLQPPWVDIQNLNYSKALDGMPEYRRVTQPNLDPQVWERVSKE
jgi:hypothetical protein